MSPKPLFRRRAPSAAARLGDSATEPSSSGLICGPVYTHSHRVLVLLPEVRAPRLGVRVQGTRGKGPPEARRAPLPEALAGSPGAAGGEPGGGVRQVRSRPRRRLSGETRGPPGALR